MDVLRKKLKDAEEENVQLKEKLKKTEDEVKLVKNMKRKTDASDGNQKKNNSKGEFAVGQKVWALYTDEKSYPAKIIACNGESYKVMFFEDKIQHEVELNGLRPFGKQLD
ncbi:hypothetical protein DPMN_175115 [Dreissena polymorpha]|uniref:Tudor domain-containing protein n=2 Tax=Dreissena polymorpha TaxID=45954 RepID=A0A9D4E8Q5_DREPO|nr:hypothetical protein DPMN_175115 [Dreissena polymorpha]